MIKTYFPTKQEFFQNPFGCLAALWIFSSAVTAILVPRASVIILTVLGLTIVIHSIVKKRLPPFPERLIVVALVSILLLGALSLFWSVAPDETLRRLPRISLLFLWGILALGAVQQATPKIASWAMTLSTLVFILALAVITIEIFFNFPVYRTFMALVQTGTRSSFVSASIINQPALLIALFLWPISLALWVKEYRFFSIALIALVLIIFVPSRSESVGLALICGTLACCFTAILPRLMKVLFSLTIIAMMIAMPVILQLLQSYLQDHKDMIAVSGIHRVEIWNFVVAKIFAQPILGYGLEASRILGANTASIIAPGASLLPLHPHNGFLQIWLELGLAGYVILGCLCLRIVHEISLLKGASMAFSAGVFVCGLSLFTTTFGMWQSWVIAVEFAVTGALLLSLKLADKSRC